MSSIVKFSEKIVLYVSGATALGVAALLFVPFVSSAATYYQPMTAAVSSDCSATLTWDFDPTTFNGVYGDEWYITPGTDPYASSTFVYKLTHGGGPVLTYAEVIDTVFFTSTTSNPKVFTRADLGYKEYHGTYIPNGTYTYAYYVVSDPTKSRYFTFEKTGDGVCTPELSYDISEIGFFSDYNTKFTSIDVTGSSTIDVDVNYYLDPDEVNTSVSRFNPTSVAFSYSLRPQSTSTSLSESIDPTITGNQSVSYNLGTLTDGVYDLHIKFNNAGCATGLSDCPFPNTYVYTDFTISGGTLTATGTPEIYDATSFNDPASQYYPCGVTTLDGCLKNVGVWLFAPSQFSTEYWENTQAYVESKIPFVYAYQFADTIDTLKAGASTTLPTVEIYSNALGTTTILSSSFLSDEPLATAAPILHSATAAIFYFVMAWYLYARTLRFTRSLVNN